MAQITLSHRAAARQRELFDVRIDTYTDQNGNKSLMRWIPKFRAMRALTSAGAALTPSGTIGDWFHPADLLPTTSLVKDTDYTVYDMGGYWVDMYLCSASNATAASAGTVASGATAAYISQPGVAPMVSQNIAHFKTYLSQRFAKGDFKGSTTATTYAGKGGLITDQHWFELWIWTRICRWLLRGNTNGYNVTPKVPQWHGDANEVGIVDGSQSANGASITGGGPAAWDVPVSDFCGNRWEFTDGLRLYNAQVYSAGKTINPPASYADAVYAATGLTITGVSSGQSIASYRTEAALALHGIPASTVGSGGGGFDGQGFWITTTGEIIARRGGSCDAGALCPGSLRVFTVPGDAGWYIGGRAVLVP